MYTFVGAMVFVSTLWWAWALYACIRTSISVPFLTHDRSPEPTSWPRVSLIIAARNEELEIEHAVRTRLADDYPNLQVVLVNDRSTDATKSICDRLALEDSRVRVVHITELPEGWLGKLHAMHQGVCVADGEWLLFSDADVVFAPQTLRRSIARCEHEQRDHLAILPTFHHHGLAIDAVMNTFLHILVIGGRLWEVTNPASRVAVGGGMFNLVRRTAYDKTPGLEWLRMEIADDVALGQMLKRHGARPLVLNAVGAVSLHFYRTLGEMAYGVEKSGFAVIARFSILRLIAVSVLGIVFELGCFLGITSTDHSIRLVGVLGTTLAIVALVFLARWMQRSVVAAFLFPFGLMTLIVMLFRSAWLVGRRGGVAWRSTLYPVEPLRAGSRIELI
jgi:glycosyltransferase involved in cell wall biosynthesis